MDNQLEPLLLACFSINNEERRAAEEQLNRASKRPECVPELLDRISRSTHAEVRQLAAIVLRKKIPGHWKKLPAEVQEQTKQVLLESIVAEPAAVVRRASADVVAVIARYTVPQGKWPGLLDSLLQLSSSPQVSHREVSIVVFSSLTEGIGEDLRPHFAVLKDVFLRALQDPQLRIRVLALKAVQALAPYISTPQEVALLSELMGPMVDVARACLSQGEEEEAIIVFEILLDVLELPIPALQGMIPSVVSFSLEVAMNREYSLSTREQALQPVAWLAVYKPKQLSAQPALIDWLLDGLFGLIREPCPEDHDDDVQLSASKFGCQCLDRLAQHLKPKLIYPKVHAYAKASIASPDRYFRTSALEAIGVTAEGCADAMRKHVRSLLTEIVLPGLRDPEGPVRGAAAVCLAQMVEFMPDKLMDRHEMVMPAAIALLADPNPEVVERGCYVVDRMCEVLEEHMDKYMDSVMAALLRIMTAGAPMNIQEMALSAITSVAAVAESAFARYAPHVLPILRHFLTQETDVFLKARCVATECLGHTCSALGPEAAEQLAVEYMPLALRGMQLEFGELREYTFGFFSELAKSLGPKVAPYSAGIVQMALEALKQEEGIADDGKKGGNFDGISSEEDEDDEFAGRGDVNYRIHTGVLEEKCAATHCLGNLAKAAGTSFAPLLPQVAPVVQELCDYFDEALRCVAYEALVNVVRCVFAVFEGRPAEECGDRQVALDLAAKRLLTAIDCDDDMEAVAVAVEGLGELLKLAKPQLCAAWLPDLFEAVDKLLQGNALCQSLEDEDEEEGEGKQGVKKHDEGPEEDEDSENETLLTTVTEVLATFAQELGPELYASVMPRHLASLVRHLRPSQPDINRGTAVGGIAELSKHMGALFEPNVPELLPAVLRELRSDDGGNRRNAAFCLGVWFESCPTPVVPQALKILQALRPLFGEEEEPSTADNAAGAVCRMILRMGDQLPLGQVLPVLVGSLPLQEDFEEAEIVVKCLGTVLTEKAPQVPDSVPKILEIFGSMALNGKVSQPVKEQLGQALAVFGKKYAEGGALQALQASLPAEVAGPVLAHIQTM